MTASDSVRDELPDPHSTAGKIADLEHRRYEAVHAGSAAAVEKQHAKGKLTARERIGLLLDDGSFTEFDELARHRAHDFGIESNRPYGDGVVTGTGTVDGRPVAVYSQDFTVFGGSLGEVYGEKIVKVMDHAMKTGCPVIGINDGGGARIQEGVVALGLFAEIFFRNTRASGVIPQISLIMGPAAGGAVYSPAITDFVLMVEGTSHMFITGPDVIKTVTGEDVTFEDLGGAHAHAARSGVAHYQASDEEDCIEFAKLLLSYLPSNNLDEPPVIPVTPDYEISPADEELDTLIPDSPNQPYDIHRVIETVLDEDTFCEIHQAFAPNIVVGFGRVAGAPVGVVANQPMHFAGCLDIDASEKAARFVRTCDAFSIPILTFVDVPGFLPGVTQEWAGIIRRGAKLLYAYAEATVPKVTVITRKAYGGAYDVMGSKHLGGDINLAWPTAQIAVMGAQGAVNILYRRELAAAADPEGRRKELTTEYEDTLANPYVAAERGYVDAVIRPAETRAAVTRALISLRTKRETLPPKKHGNIPLLPPGGAPVPPAVGRRGFAIPLDEAATDPYGQGLQSDEVSKDPRTKAARPGQAVDDAACIPAAEAVLPGQTTPRTKAAWLRQHLLGSPRAKGAPLRQTVERDLPGLGQTKLARPRRPSDDFRGRSLRLADKSRALPPAHRRGNA